MIAFATPEQSFRAHDGPYAGKPVEDLVQDPLGRAWLAAHVATQSAARQRIGLAWSRGIRSLPR